MPQPINIQPQAGPNAGTTVASVDSSGNEAINGNLTVGGAVYLKTQASAPGMQPGQVALYTTDGKSLSTVGAGGQSVSQNVSGNLAVTGNVTVGSATALGDAGVGVLELANAATPPPSNPTGGVVVYARTAFPYPVVMRDTAGNTRSLADAFMSLGAQQTFTAAGQTATNVTLAIDASATYLMEASVIISNTTGTTTPSWTGPSGATMQWVDTTSSADYSSTIGATNNTFAANAATRMILLKGLLVTAAAAGSLTLTLGVSAGTTTLLTGSYLRLARVA